jgi:hypothetical protein
MKEKYHFEDFCPEQYRKALRLARENYAFCSFTRISTSKSILWRHDVDFSMEAAYELALIEAEENVCATYFINPHSEYFNLLQLRNSELLRKIKALGHNIGLHFDCHYYGKFFGDGLTAALVSEKDLIESLGVGPVEVVSYHNPTEEILDLDSEILAGMINVYSKKFFKQIGYCSDSNGVWRFRRLIDVLTAAEEDTLQVLTHPAFWVYEGAIPPKQRIWRTIERHSDLQRVIYNTCLNQYQRDNVGGDEIFDLLEESLGSKTELLRNLFLLGHGLEVTYFLNDELEAQLRSFCVEHLGRATQVGVEEIKAALISNRLDIEAVFETLFHKSWISLVTEDYSDLLESEAPLLESYLRKARLHDFSSPREIEEAVRLFILAHKSLIEAKRRAAASRHRDTGEEQYSLKEIPQWLMSIAPQQSPRE